MRPAGSGALHGPPGIFVFRATPESFVPLQARETVIKTHLSAPWPSAVNGVMVRANSTFASVWKMHHSEVQLTSQSSIPPAFRNTFAMTCASNAILAEMRVSCGPARHTWTSGPVRRSETSLPSLLLP